MPEEAKPDSRVVPVLPATGFAQEAWKDFRPYAIKLVVDFGISAGLWVALYLFKGLTKLLKIGGWAGELIVSIHAVSIALAFIAFGILFFLDVLAIRNSKRKEGGNGKP